MPEFEIIGIVTTPGKDGKSFTTLCLTGEIPAYRAEKAIRAEGVDVTKETTTLDCSSLKVGDLVRLVFVRGFENKAQLVAIEKIK